MCYSEAARLPQIGLMTVDKICMSDTGDISAFYKTETKPFRFVKFAMVV